MNHQFPTELSGASLREWKSCKRQRKNLRPWRGESNPRPPDLIVDPCFNTHVRLAKSDTKLIAPLKTNLRPPIRWEKEVLERRREWQSRVFFSYTIKSPSYTPLPPHYRAFSHDVTAAILVYQNNETAAMLVNQTNPVGVELFSYVNAFFSSNKFAWLLAT